MTTNIIKLMGDEFNKAPMMILSEMEEKLEEEKMILSKVKKKMVPETIQKFIELKVSNIEKDIADGNYTKSESELDYRERYLSKLASVREFIAKQ